MGMRVIAVDGGEDKEAMCKKIGADHFVDFMKVSDIPAEVKKIADGLGAHGLIVTASNSAAYKNGTAMLRTSGVMMCIGLRKFGDSTFLLLHYSTDALRTAPTHDIPSIADPLTCIGRNIKVTGTIVGTRKDVREALQFAAQV
jgi:alcohol dehydrogenase, propanol-preferring